MATIDFNSVSPDGCGCTNPSDSSNVSAAISVWRNHIVNNPGDTLVIHKTSPDISYAGDFAFLIASSTAHPSGPDFPDGMMIPSCTIDAEEGTTWDNWSAWGSYGQFPFGINNTPDSLGVNQTGRCGAFIETCYAGDTTVTLTSLAEASSFVVGRWIVVGGICLSSLGGPPNFQRVEFHQIMNVTGAVIALDSPLQYSYSSTWVNSYPVEGAPTQGGAACVHRLGINWDITQVVNNIHALTCRTSTPGTFSAQPIRNITCNNCVWDETAPGMSVSQNVTLNNCTQTFGFIEFDKLNENLIIDGGHYRTFKFQSSSPNNVTIRNGCLLDVGLNESAAKNMTMDSVTITAPSLLKLGPGYGRSESLVITNSSISTYEEANRGPAADIDAGAVIYLGDGLWRWSSDDFNSAERFFQSITPGYQYAFGYLTEIYPDPQFTLPPIYFCVTDIYEAPGPYFFTYYFQTDMTYGVSGGRPTGLPSTSTWLGRPWNNFFPICQTNFTIDGVHQGGKFEATQVCHVLTDTKFAVVGDQVLDAGLSALADQADKICICSAEPTTYALATTLQTSSPDTGYALAIHDFGSPGGAFSAIFSSSSPDVPGRLVSSTAISASSISVSGTGTHWAAVDSANSRLLARGPVATAQDVTAGGTFSLPSFTIRMPGQ